MPNGDRTGPMGAGAKSGRNIGYCAGRHLPGCYHAPPTGGRAMGMGRRGWGDPAVGRRGKRHGPLGSRWPGRRYFDHLPKTDPVRSADTEEETLRSRSRALKMELETIDQQLAELETQKATS